MSLYLESSFLSERKREEGREEERGREREENEEKRWGWGGRGESRKEERGWGMKKWGGRERRVGRKEKWGEPGREAVCFLPASYNVIFCMWLADLLIQNCFFFCLFSSFLDQWMLLIPFYLVTVFVKKVNDVPQKDLKHAYIYTVAVFPVLSFPWWWIEFPDARSSPFRLEGEH